MRKLFTPLIAAAVLSGCAPRSRPAASQPAIPASSLATRAPAATVAAADAAYVAFEKSTEIAVRSGAMSLATFHDRNEQAYAVLLKVRAGQATLEALQTVIGH